MFVPEEEIQKVNLVWGNQWEETFSQPHPPPGNYCTVPYSIIQPILDYGAVVWGSNNKRHVQDIMIKLQKRCARIILDKKWDTLERPLFKKLNILPFDKRLEYLRNILVFKAFSNLAPNYITAMFTISRTFILRARETQSTIWYYQRLGPERQKCLQDFSRQELERTPKRH